MADSSSIAYNLHVPNHSSISIFVSASTLFTSKFRTWLLFAVSWERGQGKEKKVLDNIFNSILVINSNAHRRGLNQSVFFHSNLKKLIIINNHNNHTIIIIIIIIIFIIIKIIIIITIAICFIDLSVELLPNFSNSPDSPSPALFPESMISKGVHKQSTQGTRTV